MPRAPLLLVALLAGLAAAPARAQPQEIEIPPAVAKMLDGRGLSGEERKDLRVRFGVWTDEDLDTPARKAAAALLIGDWRSPALSDPGADPLDRAEATIRLGDPAAALAALDSGRDAAARRPMRAARLRGEALRLQGKLAEANQVWAAVTVFAERGDAGDADELVEGVRCMMGRARLPASLTGRDPSAGDFQRMVSLLGKARTDIDRMCWRASLAEAELLVEKDNDAEGETAARDAMKLCPRSADAFYALGSLAVDTFAFDQAERIADHLRGMLADSAHAALLSARARVRQSDPAGAGQALEDAAAACPKNPEIKAMQAAIAAAAFDYPTVDARLAEFDALFPNSAEAFTLVGRTLSDARQYAESAKYLNEAARRAPSWAEPWIDLGLMEMQFGRNEPALAALEKATTLDPFNKRAENCLLLVKEIATYQSIESPHFIVKFKGGVDGIVAREMLGPLESNHARVTGSGKGGIDFSMPDKTVIELYPDHAWFAVRIAGMPKIHTIAAATGPLIAMEAPRSGGNHLVGPYDWVRVVRHEYVHTVTLARTRNRIPHWFTEAAAVYLEDAPRDWNAVQILARAYENDGLFDFEQINIAFVRPRPNTNDRSQAYAQGHWMYEFMIERFGAAAPLALMDEYAKGVKEPEAFKTVLKVSREEFLEQFRPWAKQQLTGWGMATPDGVPSAREILKELGGGDDEDEVPLDLAMKGLEKHPDHAGILQLAISALLEKSKGAPTAEMLPLLTRYAKARPVDPLPHKLLTTWYLSGGGKSDADATDKVIEHLEYLDAREQYSAAYASELANRYGVRGDLERAWAKALRAVRIAPYDPRTRELAATVAVLRKDYAEAEHQLEALRALEPEQEIHTQRLDALKKMRGS